MNPAAIDGRSETPTPAAERRRHPRVGGPFRARVRGVDADGLEFTEDAELRDISGGGLYARLAVRIVPGAKLTAEVFLVARESCGITAAGEVVRVEALIDGRYGVAVELTGSRSI